MNPNSITLAWLRRDLRMNDHAVLHEACKQSQSIQPVFIFDSEVLSRFSNPHDRRLSFLARQLVAMHRELAAMGGGMLVLHGNAREIIPKLANRLNAAAIVCAQDFEPSTIARDKVVKAALSPFTRMAQVVDHLIHAPTVVLKDDGTPYKVFTPFSKAWRAKLSATSFDEKPVALQGKLAPYQVMRDTAKQAGFKVLNPEQGVAAMLESIGYHEVSDDLWKVEDAQTILHRFVEHKVANYHQSRDFMAVAGTSRLSPYLRFGLVSIRECARLIAQRSGDGEHIWMNELIWREFYSQILYHFPDVVEHEFQAHYRGLKWSHDPALLDAFKQGKTGFPIVDAAMRELLQTGWMHNRARMIVASFFTKDLLLDWRLGEEHFAQHLMDYELASNNGGWQWASSTGTDAQPYFRIFNPELQAKRFDEKADYIKRYVPELAALSARDILALHSGNSLLRPKDYPAPILDHKAAKEHVLRLFKEGRAA